MGKRVADEKCSMMTLPTLSHLPEYVPALILHGLAYLRQEGGWRRGVCRTCVGHQSAGQIVEQPNRCDRQEVQIPASECVLFGKKGPLAMRGAAAGRNAQQDTC